MLEKSKENAENEQMVKLESLATLTGFPVELIKKELFNDEEIKEDISLSDLRSAMVDYIDATMLEDEKEESLLS
jgi:hypothetical protein